jgi:hypothetical protein
VTGIWINDQLGVGQVLFKVQRINCVEDDIGLTTYDQDRNLDVFKVGEAFTRSASWPTTDRQSTQCRN